MRCRAIVAGACGLALLPLIAASEDMGKFTDEFPVADCDFETAEFEASDANRYFILQPGRQLHFNNFACVSQGECEEVEEVVITVLDETRDITFTAGGKPKSVTARVVQEYETENGEVTEISRNFYAECDDTQDVYYFGEDVCVAADSDEVSEGPASFECPAGLAPAGDSWLAGVNDAQPGIIFPGGAFLLGARYFQELAPGMALDRAAHVDASLEVETPAGEFEGCVAIEETTPLDPEEFSEKIYCPDTGLVIDDELELTIVIE
jgi:hypothetical protein